MSSAIVLSVNVGVPRPFSGVERPSGIDKRPVDVAVEVNAPTEGGASGLSGDAICNARHHGGPEQAVYAYAREDLDVWQSELGRPLPSGSFGENLTTAGVDATGARLGERWRIGGDLVLQVTAPRVPCNTFATWLDEQGWVDRFKERVAPGCYLRVVQAGSVRVGDPIVVEHRPDHDVTIGLAFRALTTSRHLLPELLQAGDDLIDELHDTAARHVGRHARASRSRRSSP